MSRRFFDFVYFRYLFKEISRKWTIYVFVGILLLMIASFSIIVPIIANTSAYEIYGFPISIIFLVFVVGMISIILSIEIFKSSIDDGSELLVLSKPYSRQEIAIVKMSIFIVYITIIATSASLLSLLSLLTRQGVGINFWYVSIGIFCGTIITSLLFGGLTTLLSLIVAKYKTFAITITTLILLTLYSIISMFTTKNYIKEMNDQKMSIPKVTFLELKRNGDNFIQGYWMSDVHKKQFDLNKNVKTIDIVNDYYNFTSSYNFIHYTNIFSQLSQIFMFGQTSSDLNKINDVSKIFNTPFDLQLTYNSPEVFFENPIKVKLGLQLFDDIKQINDPTLRHEITQFNNVTYLLPTISYSSYINKITNYNESTTFQEQISKISNSTGDIVLNEVDSSFWNQTWDKYKNYVEQQMSYQQSTFYKPKQFFLNKYLQDANLDITNFNSKKNNKILLEFRKLARSILYKLTYEYNDKINLFSLINPYKTIYEQNTTNNSNFSLRVEHIYNIENNTSLGNYLKNKLSIIDPTVNNKTTIKHLLDLIKNNHIDIYNEIQKASSFSTEIQTMLGILGADLGDITKLVVHGDTNFSWNKYNIPFWFNSLWNTTEQYYSLGSSVYYQRYSVQQPITLQPNYNYESFTKVEIKSFYNQVGVCVGWTVLSIVIFTISMIIYFKKDFK